MRILARSDATASLKTNIKLFISCFPPSKLTGENEFKLLPLIMRAEHSKTTNTPVSIGEGGRLLSNDSFIVSYIIKTNSFIHTDF